MPNWTHNRLTVKGALDDLADFIETVRGRHRDGTPTVLDFNGHLPTPPELLDRDPNVEYSWYQWQREHWGTKWNAWDAELVGHPEDESLMYSFNTAWRPPDAWLGFVSDVTPELRFTLSYVEELAHFAGRGVWIAGMLVEHEALDPLEVEWVEWEPFPLPELPDHASE